MSKPRLFVDVPAPLNLDFEELRRENLQHMWEALKPFVQRFMELEQLETLLQRQQGPLIREPIVENSPYERKLAIKRVAKRRTDLTPPGPYTDKSQTQAVRLMLESSPALSAREITEALMNGGMRFNSKNPLASVTTNLRLMAKKGKIEVIIPTLEERQQGLHNRYTLPPESALVRSPKMPKPPESEPETRNLSETRTVAEAIIHAVLDGPAEGLDRAGVLQSLQERGVRFAGKSRHPQAVQLTWALNTLSKQGRLKKHGQGSTAMFTAVKPKLHVRLKETSPE